MVSKIYFSREISNESIKRLFGKLLEEKGLEGSKTAIKIHFGEKGNTRYINPEFLKPVINLVKQHTDDFFLTDTNTLYRGMRTKASDHVKIAEEHGFGELDVPIKIADGEHSDNYKTVRINGDYFREAYIGRLIADSEALVTVSHFKGHVLFGFGGALKNLSMGGASRRGKLAMHSKVSPYVGSGCKECGICVENCPADAITIEKGTAVINNEKCIGCANCIAVCPYGVIKVPFHGATPVQAQERAAEYAKAAIKNKECFYITLVNNVTKDCDCLSDSEIIGNDIGILAGLDPVAMDQAAYDLVRENHDNKDIFREAGNPDGTAIIRHAEELGLGVKEYDLEEV